jgi:hypothetical protein
VKDVTAKQQLLLILQLVFQPKNLNGQTDSAARALPGDAMRLHCRGDKPGFRPGGRVTFFASPLYVRLVVACTDVQ